jgi:hypothetical protein
VVGHLGLGVLKEWLNWINADDGGLARHRGHRADQCPRPAPHAKHAAAVSHLGKVDEQAVPGVHSTAPSLLWGHTIDTHIILP